VPFLALLIFGVLVHNRPLVMLGSTLVVLLNLGRLATGLANLILIPFRDNPILGVLFFIPPITVVYCIANWKRVKKPVKRIIEPALTLAAVVLAFTFVPWLHGARPRSTGDLNAELRQGVEELESDIRKQVGTLPSELRNLPGRAQELLKKSTSGDSRGEGGKTPGERTEPGPLDRLKGVADELKPQKREDR
jgi:hypothetical protein